MNQFPFFPSLSDGVSVTYAHLTTIDRQYTGGERRRSMSSHMLRAYNFSYYLIGQEAQKAREFFDQQGVDLVLIPDWTSGVKISSQDGFDFVCEGLENLDFRCHEIFFYCASTKQYEVAALEGVKENGLQIKTALSNQVEGWRAYPMRIGRIKEKPTFSEPTDIHAEFSISFEETTESFNEGGSWLVEDSFLSYRGRRVWTGFRDGQSSTWQKNLNFSKNGYGKDTAYQKEDEAKRQISFNITRGDRADSYGLIQFFDQHKGRAEGFWLPSRITNFQLNQKAQKGEKQIQLAGGDLSLSQLEREGYQHLCLRCFDQYFFARIESITTLTDGVELVNLEEELPTDYEINTVGVQLLYYVRFSSDELKLKFKRDHWIEGKLNFIELPKEYELPSPSDKPIWLYEFTGFLNARYTSHGVEVSRLGEIWTPFDIDHNNRSEKKQSLESSCNIVMGIEDENHPFKVFQEGFPLEDTYLKIYRSSGDALDSTEIWYESLIRDIDYGAGNTITAKLGSPYAIGKAEIPTAQIEPRCSLPFGGNLCGYTPLTFSSSINAVDDLRIELNGYNGDSSYLDGIIQIGAEKRTITLVENGAVYVSSPFILAKAGDSFTIKQGCNRALSTCIRYNNLPNFGGIPFVPALNPQLEVLQIDTSVSGGGKK